MPQYPSKILKVEADEDSYLNSETFIHYYNQIMLMCTSLFKWENLPNNIPERFVEKTLFNEGQIAFVDDENIGFIMSKCTQFGELNIYDEPIAWNCYSNNGYWKAYQSEDIEIIRNNKFSYATRILIQHHLKRLLDLERTIDANLYQQRNLAIIKSNESNLLTFKNLMKKFDENGYWVYANDKLTTKDIEVLGFNIPFLADKLEDIKSIKWNELLNMFGINSVNTNKKERLITDEANANNQMIQLSADVMLTERELAVERINERFNLNIKVSLRQEIEENLNLEGGELDG